MSKILVIEDEAAVRENIIELLSEEGYDVVGADDGDEGVRLAWKELPDMIICDIMMANLDGYSVLAKISQDARFSTVPFLFLTARITREDMRHGMALGADDYITKPFTRTDLLQAISTRMNRMQKLERFAQQKLEELRKNVTANLPHELLTPLSVSLGLSELLVNQVDGLRQDEIRKTAKDIHHSTQQLVHLVQKYLLFTELDAIIHDPQKMAEYRSGVGVEAVPIINAMAREKVRQAGRESDLELRLQPARLWVFNFHLVTIVEELIDNALLFSSGGSPLRIDGNIIPGSELYRLSVRDQGRGMKPGQVRAVDGFVQYEHQLPENNDLGLGLFLVKRLCSLYEGNFHITSRLGQGTQTQVELPIQSVA